MLGAAGCIAPEILGKAGIGVDIRWFETGVIPPAGTYGNYWTDPYSLFFIEVIAMQFAELRRWQDFRWDWERHLASGGTTAAAIWLGDFRCSDEVHVDAALCTHANAQHGLHTKQVQEAGLKLLVLHGSWVPHNSSCACCLMADGSEVIHTQQAHHT